MSQLQLLLLGTPIVNHGEHILSFSTHKALALLVYLAVEGGTHTRKTLSESFWPELDAEHGRAALRATLLELRKLLERCHEPGERAHLQVERDTLGIAQGSQPILDLQLVESASKQAGHLVGPFKDQAGGELLAQLEQEQERAPDELLSEVWLAELSRLLPELSDRYPDLPIPVTDEALGHNRLFEAVARLVQLWAAQRPLVLLLDDMQWADTATLDLLLYLTRSLAQQPAPVLLLLNLCIGADSCTGAQSTWLMALKRTRIPLTTLELAAFSQEETQRFVQALAWAEQPLQVGNNGSTDGYLEKREDLLSRDSLVPFANWLYFLTRGQPLYLVETLKGLLTRGIIVPSLQENSSWGLVLLTGLLAQTPVGELTRLTAGEWGVGGHIAPDIPRSPPGRTFQSFFETR